jgi:hypothetical protein
MVECSGDFKIMVKYYNTKTFGDLYSYLENFIKFGDGKKEPMINGCDNKHTRTKEFCKLNGINFEKLYKEHLKTTGGCCCDCEVLLNTADKIKEDLCIVQ